MKKLDNKGFTLVELIATLVVIAMISTIAGISIKAVMDSSNENNYNLLIENINNAVDEYYIECMSYGNDYDSITCPSVDGSGWYKIQLSSLVTYGFLSSNGDNNDIVNPLQDNASIGACWIKYKYEGGKVNVLAVDPAGACPASY